MQLGFFFRKIMIDTIVEEGRGGERGGGEKKKEEGTREDVASLGGRTAAGGRSQCLTATRDSVTN